MSNEISIPFLIFLMAILTMIGTTLGVLIGKYSDLNIFGFSTIKKKNETNENAINSELLGAKIVSIIDSFLKTKTTINKTFFKEEVESLIDGLKQYHTRFEEILSGQGNPITGLEIIRKEVNKLEKLFEERLRYDNAKEKAFDSLYERMKQYEGNYQASIKNSLIRSLLLLHDNMVTIETDLEDQPIIQKYISALRQELLDILYAEDVEPMGDLGKQFDHQLQQGVHTVPTVDLAKDNRVERVVREGFYIAGKVLRPQSVMVFRYQNHQNSQN